MKYDFWTNVNIGDKLYFYDTDTWKINHFYIKDIKDKSDYSGSFILETTCKEHHNIYVNVAKFLMDGLVNTWDCSTYNLLFISNDRYELINHLKYELQKKVNELKNRTQYYQDLLNNL